MNAELVIASIFIAFIVIAFGVIVWLAMQVQKTKDSLKIDTGKANEEALQKHLIQMQQQERLKNMGINELDIILNKLHNNKENNSK